MFTAVYLRSGWCGKNVSIFYDLTLQAAPRFSNERSPLFVINSGVAIRIAFSSVAAGSKFESEAKERGVPNGEQHGTEAGGWYRVARRGRGRDKKQERETEEEEGEEREREESTF